MNDHTPDTREPLKVVMYGNAFVSLDGAIRMSVSGPNGLQTLARKLLAIGYDPDQKVDVERGGKRMARLPLREAAQEQP
jgi:hypothetical protein